MPPADGVPPQSPACGVPVERITAEVLKAYGLEERDLFRRGNREAKDVWLKLALEEGGLGQREIGVRVGHADGSTVSRRLLEVAAGLAADRPLRCRYEELRRRITDAKACPRSPCRHQRHPDSQTNLQERRACSIGKLRNARRMLRLCLLLYP